MLERKRRDKLAAGEQILGHDIVGQRQTAGPYPPSMGMVRRRREVEMMLG